MSKHKNRKAGDSRYRMRFDGKGVELINPQFSTTTYGLQADAAARMIADRQQASEPEMPPMSTYDGSSPATGLRLGEDHSMLSRFEGCLLGGAMGDALGARVEFQRLPEILRDHGSHGVRRMPQGALITDDTQMTLFGAEGLIQSETTGWDLKDAIWAAYQRWLVTQYSAAPAEEIASRSGLAGLRWLYASRAPGSTCMSGLRTGQPVMHSKGNGGVMRAAPFGLQPHKSPRRCFHEAAAAASLTHGHPSGYLPAGAQAAMIRCMLDGMTVERAAYKALDILRDWRGHEDTSRYIRMALALAHNVKPGTDTRSLRAWTAKFSGGGWTGDEGLGLALFSVLATLRARGTFLDAISLAVTHDGDSDTTGAIAGNLAGALGTRVLPEGWAEKLEGGKAARVIKSLAAQLLAVSKL